MRSRALRRMAADIDEQHREGMRTIRDDLGELHFGGTPAVRETRRGFAGRMAAGATILFGATAIPVAGMVPAALAQEAPGTTSTTGKRLSNAEPRLEDKDLQLAIFAETVELAAVALYQAAAASGLLSQTLVDVGTMFAGHHADHAGQFAAFAGRLALGTPNQKLLDELTPKLTAATSEVEVLQLARAVEEGAAATYVYAMGALQSRDAAAAVATILPVEAQHSVALSFAIDGTDEAFLARRATNVPVFENEAQQLDAKKYAVTSS